jgi:hypothetical protein
LLLKAENDLGRLTQLDVGQFRIAARRYRETTTPDLGVTAIISLIRSVAMTI